MHRRDIGVVISVQPSRENDGTFVREFDESWTTLITYICCRAAKSVSSENLGTGLAADLIRFNLLVI